MKIQNKGLLPLCIGLAYNMTRQIRCQLLASLTFIVSCTACVREKGNPRFNYFHIKPQLHPPMSEQPSAPGRVRRIPLVEPDDRLGENRGIENGNIH
jgi:hypothetical protein